MVAVVSVLPAAPEAAGWSVPLAPEVSLRDRLPLVMPGLVVLDEPDAPLPMEPELPEVSLLDDGELLGVDEDEPDAPLPMVPELPEAPVVDDGELLGEDEDEPDAPLPMVPELPEVSLLDDGELLGVDEDEPDAPLPMVPELPEVPVLPDMPASFLLELLDIPLPVEELVPEEVCASTIEETDATRTNDSDRIVFDLMNGSLS